MSKQGFMGALDQFWTVNEAPRLNRKNTFFDNHKASNADALRFGLAIVILATAMVVCWSLMGLMV